MTQPIPDTTPATDHTQAQAAESPERDMPVTEIPDAASVIDCTEAQVAENLEMDISITELIFDEVPDETPPEAATTNITRVDVVASIAELRPDLSIEHINSLLFDSQAYYQLHEDVRKAGIDALEHYFTFGIKENRHLPRLPIQRGHDYTYKQGYTVGISCAGKNNMAHKYRLEFPKDEEGYTFIFDIFEDLLEIIKKIFISDRLVFLRPEANEITLYVLSLAINLGLHIQFDFDDLLLPEFTHLTGAIRSKAATIDFDFISAVSSASLLPLANSISCSTEILADCLKYVGRPCRILNNKLKSDYFLPEDKIDSLLDSKQDGPLKLLYPPGTLTHRMDYARIHGVLLALCEKFGEKLDITIIGKAQDQPGFKLFESSFRYIDIMPVEDFMLKLTDYDVALTPLEHTIFNHAKSNIKYIEAAARAVPVIATPTPEFAKVIRHNINGWLCETDHEWWHVIEQLIIDKSKLKPVGIEAYRHAKKELCYV